jgi:hypothetical protein
MTNGAQNKVSPICAPSYLAEGNTHFASECVKEAGSVEWVEQSPTLPGLFVKRDPNTGRLAVCGVTESINAIIAATRRERAERAPVRAA